MHSITIITIVVVALLTVIIFGLAWLGWSSCLKAYKIEVNQGKHDTEIIKEYHAKKKNKGGLIGLIGSYLALLILSGLFVTGIVYKINGENLTINNQTVLVIKSGSMSDFYDDEIAQKHNYDTSLHFDVGDICVFERVADDTNLVKGEVYGYKYNKNIIITHRFIEKCGQEVFPNIGDSVDGYYLDITCEQLASGLAQADTKYYTLLGYRFWGDNNPFADQLLVQRDNIIYHYLGTKIPGVGAFILYAQSYFGIWSLISIIGVAISSEIVYHQLDKINKDRDKALNKPENTISKPEQISEPKKEEIKTEQREIKVQFRRRDGTLVTIYKKKSAPKTEVANNEK